MVYHGIVSYQDQSAQLPCLLFTSLHIPAIIDTAICPLLTCHSLEMKHLMNISEGQHPPTVLQQALGEPLRSEQRTGALLPRVLSRVDMLVIFIAIVLFIPNASVVQFTQGAGVVTYVYWVLGTVTFLLPGAIVTGQLYRFMPVEGSIYVWTHRAL